MHLNAFFPSPSLFSLIITLFLYSSHASNPEFERCTPFECGKFKGLRYPFWTDFSPPPFCGHPDCHLDCQQDNPSMSINSVEYTIIDIHPDSRILTIARKDYFEEDGICQTQSNRNIFMDGTLLRHTKSNLNALIFYDCEPFENTTMIYNFSCPQKNGHFVVDPPHEFEVSLMRRHDPVKVWVLRKAVEKLRGLYSVNITDISNILREGFEVEWVLDEKICRECEGLGGRCAWNFTESLCFCPEGDYRTRCHIPPPPIPSSPSTAPTNKISNKGNGLNKPQKFGIGIGVPGAGILLICLVFFIYHRRFRKRYASSLMSRNISSDPSSITDLEKSNIYFGVHIFSYAELEEATNNFDSKKELGDGGFGTVYKGKLRDGRVVAVKRLYENNFKRVEQFMNEVEILTRLRHQNLVTLYGCTSRHCRELLLVYEYIPNGTVADHLHGDRAGKGLLTWKTRMSIAVETASALAFLHASDVIHRDVKTNNILLESNFRVKVADFGLSRLFPTNVTHVSTAPQGTPGYVDPEYHHCYQLTDKSDVFSFGVVLVELISSMPAVDITRHRHEINLSTMAINKIQRRALNELVDPNLGFDSDYKARKMINDVAELAFQCLQNGREMRPSMEEVLEALKEIRRQDYGEENGDDDAGDVPPDDAVLLKSNPLILSPDSVTANWVSRNSTTTNASG